MTAADFAVCRTCRYARRMAGGSFVACNVYCGYVTATGMKRGCPGGAGCTRFEEGAVPHAIDIPKYLYDSQTDALLQEGSVARYSRAAETSRNAKVSRRESQREQSSRRRAQGLCPQCGLEPPEEGYALCPVCREKQKEARQLRRQEREAKGLCIRCGKAPARPGRLTCQACAERKRQ